MSYKRERKIGIYLAGQQACCYLIKKFAHFVNRSFVFLIKECASLFQLLRQQSRQREEIHAAG